MLFRSIGNGSVTDNDGIIGNEDETQNNTQDDNGNNSNNNSDNNNQNATKPSDELV